MLNKNNFKNGLQHLLNPNFMQRSEERNETTPKKRRYRRMHEQSWIYGILLQSRGLEDPKGNLGDFAVPLTSTLLVSDVFMNLMDVLFAIVI